MWVLYTTEHSPFYFRVHGVGQFCETDPLCDKVSMVGQILRSASEGWGAFSMAARPFYPVTGFAGNASGVSETDLLGISLGPTQQFISFVETRYPRFSPIQNYSMTFKWYSKSIKIFLWLQKNIISLQRKMSCFSCISSSHQVSNPDPHSHPLALWL